MQTNTLAFTNSTYTKQQAVELATLHRTADAYIRGTYGHATESGWKGCSVGCMAKGSHSDYPKLFGIDTRIAHLSDRFFEHLPEDSYKDFTINLFSSIKEGIDTTVVWYRFMHWMLLDPAHGVIKYNQHESIVAVGDLFLKAANGEIVTKEQWQKAATAAYAADTAADTAAYAAAAARKSQCKLMSEKLCYFLSGGV